MNYYFVGIHVIKDREEYVRDTHLAYLNSDDNLAYQGVHYHRIIEYGITESWNVLGWKWP